MATMPTRTQVQVTGMTCQNCVGHVTSELEAVGAQNVAVDLNSGGISTVTFSSAQPLDEAVIVEAIDEAGYDVVPPITAANDEGAGRRARFAVKVGGASRAFEAVRVATGKTPN